MARTAQVNGTALVGTMMVAGVLMAAAPGAGAAAMVTLEKAAYGPYSGQAVVVANSPSGWTQAMATLEAAGSLLVSPAPEAPAGVDWATEVVVLVAAGASGYDVELQMSQLGDGRTQLDAAWAPLGADGGESLPYHLVKLPKVPGLTDRAAGGSAAPTMLPLVGDGAPSVPAVLATWGQVKAAYR